MNDESPLCLEYHRIQANTNAQQRGYDFQELVSRLLGRYHFTVETKPRVAQPRQVDLFASRADAVYLIETKWRRDKANIADVDSLYTRLQTVPAGVVGLLVSHAGFTQQVIDRVREKSDRPVVLVTGKEFENALTWSGDFIGMLQRKQSALLVHRDVQVDVDLRRPRGRSRTRTNSADLPQSDHIFVFPDGKRSRWLACDGTFAPFTFVPELQDIDWLPGPGLGVTLDVHLPGQEQEFFTDLLHQLAKMGWVTPKGCWSIKQATANWHGFGADALVEALQGWEQRYSDLETHHTEELYYADECDDGFFSIFAQLSADTRRIVRRVELSFQLRGVPLDTGPYRELCKHFGLRDPVYFRPRNERSQIRGRPPGILPVVKPVAYVVNLEQVFRDDDEWVAGIVVENPFFQGKSPNRIPKQEVLADDECSAGTVVEVSRRHRSRVPEWVPRQAIDSRYLVCVLRSWHTLDEPKSIYELWEFESAWTSDALVIRALADWRDDR